MNAMLPFPDLSPEIFSFTLFGMTVALRWYALAYIVGILVGWRIVVRAVERPRLWAGNTPVMTKQQVEDLLSHVVLAAEDGDDRHARRRWDNFYTARKAVGH